MADVNLNTTNTKYIDYTNANRIFMLSMTKFKKEQQMIKFNQLKNVVSLITSKFKSLSPTELDQWVQIYELKIKEIYRTYQEKPVSNGFGKSTKIQQYSNTLRQALHILIWVTQQCHLEYNSSMIADIIEDFYYQEYKEQVFGALEQAGFKTNKYKTLQYEQASFFNLCCCWESSSR